MAASGLGWVLKAAWTGLVDYLVDLVVTSARAWHRFFFTPADPTTLGLIRIALGLLLVWNQLNVGIDLRAMLSSDGWASMEALTAFYQQANTGKTAWSFWFYVPDSLVPAVWAVCLGITVLFTLGLFSRVTAILAWIITVSTVRRAPVMFFGFDQTIVGWTMYLAVTMASGQALSLDRLWALQRGRVPPGPPPPTVSANLGLRLLQLHLCLIYAAAGLTKLQGESWWSGNAVSMILLYPEYRTSDLTWLLAYPRWLNLLTHGTVALEILYPCLIWVRVLRPLMLTGMILLHLGIDLTLGLGEFTLAMITANLAFIPGSWLRRIFGLFSGAGPPPLAS
jgi:hypothetical protein